MFRRWVDDHFKLVGAFLLILAALNLLISYTLRTATRNVYNAECIVTQCVPLTSPMSRSF